MKQLKRYGKTAIAGILAAALLAGCAGEGSEKMKTEEQTQESGSEETTSGEESQTPQTMQYIPTEKVSALKEAGIPKTDQISLSPELYEGGAEIQLSVTVPDTDQVERVKTQIRTFDNAFLKLLADNVADDVQWNWEGKQEKLETEEDKRSEEGSRKESAEASGRAGTDLCQLEVHNYLGAKGERASMAHYLRFPDKEMLSGLEKDGMEIQADTSYLEMTGAWSSLQKPELTGEYEDGGLQVPKEEAIRQAENFLKQIGIANVEAISAKGAVQEIRKFRMQETTGSEKPEVLQAESFYSRKGWMVRFRYVMDRIPINVLNPNSLMEEELQAKRELQAQQENELRKQMAAEQGISEDELEIPPEFNWDHVFFPNELSVVVGDNGIMEFTCYSPIEYEKAVTKMKSNLITWGELRKVVEYQGRYLQQLGEKYPGSRSLPDRVELGYMISKTDDDQYELIPVWDFYNELNPAVALLTINAMDGMYVIRPERGYI